MKKLIAAAIVLMLLLCGCGGASADEETSGGADAEAEAAVEAEEESSEGLENAVETNYMIQMKIGDTPVSVSWEQNEAVDALAALNAGDWHEYQLSMYGGFEQVGSLGSELPSDDAQTSTSAGDIVLYQSNQIVVFYGENSWAYTRLGHITDKSADELAELLGNGDVVISLKAEYSE